MKRSGFQCLEKILEALILAHPSFVQHEYPSLASQFEILLKEWQGANLDNPQFCKPPIPSSRHGSGEIH